MKKLFSLSILLGMTNLAYACHTTSSAVTLPKPPIEAILWVCGEHTILFFQEISLGYSTNNKQLIINNKFVTNQTAKEKIIPALIGLKQRTNIPYNDKPTPHTAKLKIDSEFIKLITTTGTNL
jgi:hypothetical protein